MPSAPTPENEKARKRALDEYQVLDTGAEQVFEDIARLAAEIFKTPTALISLVDSERQWFKAHVGLNATETPREQAFCAHAILNPGEVMVVPDATKDPRFADNPLVTAEPSIRFYAGAPLVAATGEALGTLCIIDSQPRKLLPEQADVLRALSRQVMAHFEMRRSISALETAMASGEGVAGPEPAATSARGATDFQGRVDQVTALATRKTLERALQEEVARASGTASLSLLLLDVDFFAHFCESFGADAGDDVLRAVAEVLRARLRPFDIVSRYEGERFAVLMPVTDNTKALVLAERCRRDIQGGVWSKRPISVSIGVATLAAGQTGAALMEAAHRALYKAQAEGRNRSVNG